MKKEQKVKQVIVFRQDLIKGKNAITKGKIATQVAHASLGAVLSMMDKTHTYVSSHEKEECDLESTEYKVIFEPQSILDKWLNGIFTKICLSIENDDALKNLYYRIKEERADIPCVLITDYGKAFNNVPTNTCVGIGPFWSDDIDIFTKNLKLMR